MQDLGYGVGRRPLLGKRVNRGNGRLYPGIYERRGKGSNLRGLTPTPQLGHLRALLRLYIKEYKLGEGYSSTGLAVRTGAMPSFRESRMPETEFPRRPLLGSS
jgi:hypothetical protein